MPHPIKIFEREVSRWLQSGGVAESLCGNQRSRSGVICPGERCPMCSALFAAACKAAGVVKLQPISCGRNWGFGSDLPAEHGAYTLDLSALNTIRSLDLKSHCVQLEPGVTQGQLDEA